MKFKNCITLLKVIIFIFHKLEKVLVRRTGTFHYKKALGLLLYGNGIDTHNSMYVCPEAIILGGST